MTYNVPLGISMSGIVRLLTKITQVKFTINVVLYNAYMCQFYSTLPARSSSCALLSDKRVRDFECTPLLSTGRKSLVRHSSCKSRVRIYFCGWII